MASELFNQLYELAQHHAVDIVTGPEGKGITVICTNGRGKIFSYNGKNLATAVYNALSALYVRPDRVASGSPYLGDILGRGRIEVTSDDGHMRLCLFDGKYLWTPERKPTLKAALADLRELLAAPGF